jgi:hypothetical protein
MNQGGCTGKKRDNYYKKSLRQKASQHERTPGGILRQRRDENSGPAAKRN